MVDVTSNFLSLLYFKTRKAHSDYVGGLNVSRSESCVSSKNVWNFKVRNKVYDMDLYAAFARTFWLTWSMVPLGWVGSD